MNLEELKAKVAELQVRLDDAEEKAEGRKQLVYMIADDLELAKAELAKAEEEDE